LVGIERSGPRVCWNFPKNFSKFAKKIRSQNQSFDFLPKKFSGSGSLAHAAWNSEPATRPSLNFSKAESDLTSPASARVRRLDCPGECLLVMEKLACGSTEAKGRL
jgi:hypothetical protein